MIIKALAVSVGLLVSAFAANASSPRDATSTAPARASSPAASELVTPFQIENDPFQLQPTNLTCPAHWHICNCPSGPICAPTQCGFWC
jgi:hypothetical protein